MKILMVCLGNICRSPLAHGILEHKIKEKGMDWHVDSAGTGAYHIGEHPDSRSIAVAEKYGIDIHNQRARKFTKSDFKEFDKIYVMDSSNYQNVLAMADNDSDKKKVILIMNEVFPSQNMQVPDPYWNDDGFESVFKMLDKATAKILDKYS